ncbi:MAG TPA: hypothetical protein VGO25_03795, partial [Rhodanobacteraceae bacterium]|nr:hypothetical protein [Rhodanobacteraceae bacterium]
VVWYAWHVPLYAAEEKLPGLGEHALFLFSCISLSVIMTWFFLNSGGSTFLMIYLHDATNFSTFLRFRLFPKSAESMLPLVVYIGLLLIAALLAAPALSRRTQANRGSAVLPPPT